MKEQPKAAYDQPKSQGGEKSAGMDLGLRVLSYLISGVLVYGLLGWLGDHYLGTKFLLPIGKPLAGWMGVSLYGSAKHLAQQSGGEALRVNRTRDYGVGLAKIIGNLTARYSLGFSLSEAEKDDGRMHELSLRVKAADAKGKTRKLEVSSRRGYFMPKNDGDQTAANQ